MRSARGRQKSRFEFLAEAALELAKTELEVDNQKVN
jgi:hypothetical protein